MERTQPNDSDHGGKSDSFPFTALTAIGKGSFGVVFKAVSLQTGVTVALKRVFQDKRYKNRELDILKQLLHPNIVHMQGHFYEAASKSGGVNLNIVMEYIPNTLSRVAKNYRKERTVLPRVLLKLYSYQILRAVAQCHALGIAHRDIKPQNILVEQSTHSLRLCDFGSAKLLVRGEQSLSYICSRYYRAPELIFGSTAYTVSVDIWSVGCVVAELVLGRPLFPGQSGVDQLVEIIKVLGTPKRRDIYEMNPYYAEYKFPHVKVESLWERLGKLADEQTVEFLHSLLVYSPEKRPGALRALAHPFFDELRLEGAKLPEGTGPLPCLFDWTEEETNSVSAQLLSSLTPGWFSSATTTSEAGN